MHADPSSLSGWGGPHPQSFDAAPLTGRLSGPLGTAPDVVARSSMAQQAITNDQVSTTGGPGRLRFQTSAAGPWYDWAAGAGAANMLAAGGMQVSFDWVPTDNTQTDWVNISVGQPHQPRHRQRWHLRCGRNQQPGRYRPRHLGHQPNRSRHR